MSKVARDEVEDSASVGGPIAEMVRESLPILGSRHADIVRRRLGMGRDPQTLQAAANDLSLTRERVRQIEEEARAMLSNRCAWPDALRDSLLSDLPLRIADLSGRPWARDLDKERILRAVHFVVGRRAHVLTVGGEEWLLAHGGPAWRRLVAAARSAALDVPADGEPAMARARAVATLGRDGSHADLLLAAIGWPAGDVGWRRAMGYRDPTVAQVIDAVLDAAAGPLTLVEVLAEVGRTSRHVPVPQAVGEHLRQAYGSDAHGRFAKGARPQRGRDEILAAAAAGVVATGPAGRAWKSVEILRSLRASGAVAEIVDARAIDEAVAASGLLERRGVVRWAMPGSTTLADATLAAMGRLGRPVSRGDVDYAGWEPAWASLFARTNPDIAYFPNAAWGLVGRDLPSDAGYLASLRARSAAIVSSEGAIALAQLVRRLRTEGLGGGLPQCGRGALVLGAILWAEPGILIGRGVARPPQRRRTDTVAAIVKAVLDESGASGIDEVEAYRRVAERMGRVPTPVLVRAALKVHGERNGTRPVRWVARAANRVPG